MKAKNKKYDPIKEQRRAHREALINAGVPLFHREKSVPSAKQYKRHSRTGKAYLGA